uniref:G-protein coupled receptors family 1 profile domain-containing protein n=1 Tax=Neogobius melanostomus TaxID=47308 RepID=A0A8C6V054_9GOBI
MFSSQWSTASSSPALTALTNLTWEYVGTRFPNDSTIDDTSEAYDYTYIDYNEYDMSKFEPCSYKRHGAYFLPILFTLFFLLGFVGNVLVLWVIVCGVRLKSMTDVCLLNLAVADLLLVCTLPFLAHQAWDQWRCGDAMCKLVLGIYNIVFYCGIFFICLMSIDRYLAIVHAIYAMRARTRSYGMIAAGVTWMVGFLASFPDNLFLQEKSMGDRMLCFPSYPANDESEHNNGSEFRHFWRVFSVFKMNVMGLFVPLLIMGFCYSQILWRLMSSQTSKKQAIRLVVIVVIVFFCCWVPYNIASFFKALELLGVYTECASSQAIVLALQVTQAVSYSHSCLNPILYVFVGEKFKKHLMRLINKAPCKMCRFIKVLLPQDRARGSVYSQTSSLDERSTAV